MAYLKEFSFYCGNANGLRDQNTLRATVYDIVKFKATFFFLLESHIVNDDANRVKKLWKNDFFIAEGATNARGILLLCNKNSPTFNNLDLDPNGRYIIASFSVNEKVQTLVCIYAPSGGFTSQKQERKEFFIFINKKLQFYKDRGDEIFLFGDFNVTLAAIDRSSARSSSFSCESQGPLRQILSDLSLTDVWRDTNPDDETFTFFSKSSKVATRIDRCYSGKDFSPCVVTNYIDNYFSDHHYALLTKYSTSKIERGKGIWCLNNSLLQHEEYREKIKQLITFQKSKILEFPGGILEWWDFCKESLKFESILFSQKLSKERKKLKNSIEKRLRNLYRKLPQNPNHIQRITELNDQLKTIISEEAFGASVRARFKWEAEGEQCSKTFFSSLEKSGTNHKAMHSIYSAEGKLMSSQEGIIGAVKDFYKNLFSDEGISELSQNIMLSKTKTARLSSTSREKCEHDITKKDIREAVNNMNNNKSPGCDGLSAEFYKAFLDDLIDPLHTVLNHVAQNGIMTDSMQTGIISCLYKKGDRNDLKNWRPISLLNLDYKIYTKVLANKIIPVLDEIISPNQTAAIPNRTILDNLSLIRDVIDENVKSDSKFYIVALDQEKAFDRLNWKFMFKTLKHFGFGPKIIKMIKAAYTNIKSKVKINNHVSEAFSIERGVRQGCPLSMILYIICAEVLGDNIREEKNIKGYKIDDQTSVKLSQFADDTTNLLSDISSMESLMDLLKLYEQASGAKMNLDKCEILVLGVHSNEELQKLPFKHSTKKIKILGINFSPDYEIMQQNWDEKIVKLEKKISLWKNIRMSLIGKRIVINQCLLSKFCYLAQVIPHNKIALQKIDEKITNFLWSDKKIIVKKIATKLPINKGGLGVIDIFHQVKALKLTLIKRIQQGNQETPWARLAEKIIGRYHKANLGLNTLYSFLTLKKHDMEGISTFYRQLLSAWVDLTQRIPVPPKTLPEIYNQPLFHNTLIHPLRNLEPFPPQPDFCKGHLDLVGDLCAIPNKGFISLAMFEALTGTKDQENFFQKLLSAIPNEWKHKINNDVAINKKQPLSVEIKNSKNRKVIVKFDKIKCKQIYNTLLLNSPAAKAYQPNFKKWELEFKPPIDPKIWPKFFQHIWKTKLKSSHEIRWRLMHMGHPTGEILKEIGAIESDTCTRCNNAKETHKHWFYNCQMTQDVFIYLTDLLDNKFPEHAFFYNSLQMCLFGPQLCGMNVKSVAIDELWSMFYIAVRRMRFLSTYGELPDNFNPVEYFKGAVKNRIKYLYQAAKLHNHLEGFMKEWSVFCDGRGIVSLN